MQRMPKFLHIIKMHDKTAGWSLKARGGLEDKTAKWAH
jgi:hypothetical protein